MTRKLPSFPDHNEQDKWRWTADQLLDTARLLPVLTRHPELVRYRLSAAGADTPMLPSMGTLAEAQRALQQVAECLQHFYRQRIQYDDEPDPWRETDGSLDDEVAF